MQATQTSDERRRRRSADSTLATRYQLEQVVQDFDLTNCILVDESGRLVQSAGWFTEFEEALAREVPRLAAGSACRSLFARLGEFETVAPDQITAYEFRANGRRLFVAAVGSLTTMRDVGVFRAILGIRRIERERLEACA